jgi:hypothetical protein
LTGCDETGRIVTCGRVPQLLAHVFTPRPTTVPSSAMEVNVIIRCNSARHVR